MLMSYGAHRKPRALINVQKLTERMSRSCRLGIFNHLRRKCFFTLGSAWKIARGMALRRDTQMSNSRLSLLVILQY